jgi:hypothetical protein
MLFFPIKKLVKIQKVPTQRRQLMRLGLVGSRKALIEMIGLCRPNPDDNDSLVSRVLLWDGRIVDSRYAGKKKPDIETSQNTFPPDDLVDIAAFVDRMLRDRTSFVTKTGNGDQVCTLEWSIIEIR